MKTIVEVIEHDNWSGRSLAFTRKYKHRRSALRYIKKVNSENTKPQVPSCYWTAHIKGESIWDGEWSR